MLSSEPWESGIKSQSWWALKRDTGELAARFNSSYKIQPSQWGGALIPHDIVLHAKLQLMWEYVYVFLCSKLNMLCNLTYSVNTTLTSGFLLLYCSLHINRIQYDNTCTHLFAHYGSDHAWAHYSPVTYAPARSLSVLDCNTRRHFVTLIHWWSGVTFVISPRQLTHYSQDPLLLSGHLWELFPLQSSLCEFLTPVQGGASVKSQLPDKGTIKGLTLIDPSRLFLGLPRDLISPTSCFIEALGSL